MCAYKALFLAGLFHVLQSCTVVQPSNKPTEGSPPQQQQQSAVTDSGFDKPGSPAPINSSEFVGLAVADNNIPTPACDSQHRGQAVYQRQLHRFLFCTESDWQELAELNSLFGSTPAPSPKPCSVSKVGRVSTLTCPDGTTASVTDGQDGQPGPAGIQGALGIPGNAGANGAAGSPGAAGAAGKNSLVAMFAESAGVNCTYGGKRIATGTDDGVGGGTAGNGILEAGEIRNSGYLCNGATGATGVTGAQGQQGIQGVAGTAGANGSNGFNSLVSIVPELPGSNCPAGGIKVLSGLDSGASGGHARDGILQVGEVQSTAFVCNAANGPLKLYSALGVEQFQFVSIIPIVDSYQTGVIVKNLSDNSYAAYSFGGALSGASTGTSGIDSYGSTGQLYRLNVGSNLNYASAGCTGQAYLEASSTPSYTAGIQARNLLTKFPNLYLSFGQNEVTAGTAYQVSVPGANTRYVANGTGGCSSDTNNAAGGIPVSVRAATFPATIAAGWYVAP